jgi:hypothetical protein
LVQHTKTGKIYQTTVKFATLLQNMPNGHKICRHLPLQDPPKFTQFGIFGLKVCHLATLVTAGMAAFQGCQIFLGATNQFGKNIPNWPPKIPNGHKIYSIAI